MKILYERLAKLDQVEIFFSIQQITNNIYWISCSSFSKMMNANAFE